MPGWSATSLDVPALPAALGDGVVLADANDDGLDDLVVATTAGRIHVAHAAGDGSFADFDDGIAGDGLVGVADFNGDGRPDFVTRTGWIRSCGIENCGTCDVDGYRCDEAPPFDASAASLADLDGNGSAELAVVATEASEAWGPRSPEVGDLVIIERPATSGWSARVIAVPGTPTLADSGDIDGDARDDLVLVDDAGGLTLVYGGDEAIETVDDFDILVDVHVQAGSPTLAVVSEDADGEHRRLSLLSAAAGRQLRSTTKLELEVVPRWFVGGRFAPRIPRARHRCDRRARSDDGGRTAHARGE